MAVEPIFPDGTGKPVRKGHERAVCPMSHRERSISRFVPQFIRSANVFPIPGGGTGGTGRRDAGRVSPPLKSFAGGRSVT